MRPLIVEFCDFVTGLRAVEAAVARGASKPYSDDPVLNAYDLAERRQPAPYRLAQALRSAGFRKPRGCDNGVWRYEAVEALRAAYRQREGILIARDRAERLAVSFHNYLALKSGQKRKFRLRCESGRR